MTVQSKWKSTLQNMLQLLIGLPIILGVAYILFFSPQWGILHKIKFTQLPAYATPKPYIDTLQVFNLINDYRAAHNLSMLMFDPYMCPFTKKRLQQIHTDFSHAGFLADTTYCKHQPCRYSGENLAQGQVDEKDIVQQWLSSPEHLANISKTEYTLTCIAIDKFQNSWFSVQEFASNF